MYLWLLLFACGEDPILQKAREATATPGHTAPGSPTPPKPGTPPPVTPVSSTAKPGTAIAPAPGIPDEPAPGRPDEPSPNGVGIPDQPPPGGGIGVPQSGSAHAGPQVQINGDISFSTWKVGQIRVSAFDGPHANQAASNPKIVGEVRLDQPGPFSLMVPENIGNIYLEAAVDEDMDGRPGPQDPQGTADLYPLSVGNSAVSGVMITLQRREPPPGTKKKDDF